MREYLDIIQNVISNGKWKVNRTGIRAKTTFCETFRHDMSKGFPLLTTKQMYMRGVAVELEGFIKGITDKRWYQGHKCRIWNEWANPKAVAGRYARGIEEAKKRHTVAGELIDVDRLCKELNLLDNKKFREHLQQIEHDLGPIYGYQWRRFDEHYPVEWDEGPPDFGHRTDLDWEVNGVHEGADQLKKVVDTLKSDPDDRRMVVSAWNPNQISLMALPPCHYAFTLVHIDGVLNLSWKQRSCDLMLGVPFNIASYALLLELLCKEGGLIPGELFGLLEDCHIYENQIEGARQQLDRDPKTLPTITIDDTGTFNIFDWEHKDYSLCNYKCHPKIDFGKVAV